MKKNILLSCLLLISSMAFSQQYYFEGRFSNIAPDSTSLDSTAFEFANSQYDYYINNSTTPSSHGAYGVVLGLSADSLILMEEPSGVCVSDSGGSRIAFKLGWSTGPFDQIIITETTQSIDSCPSHSYKIQGDYNAPSGSIHFISASVKGIEQSALQTILFSDRLEISSQYNEKITMHIMNMAGQKIQAQESMLYNGQPAAISFSNLAPGMYFIVLRTEHEQRAVRILR